MNYYFKSLRMAPEYSYSMQLMLVIVTIVYHLADS